MLRRHRGDDGSNRGMPMIVRYVRRNYAAILTTSWVAVLIGQLLSPFLHYAIGIKDGTETYQTIIATAMIPFLLALLVLYVLIFSRRLRDEYQEKIWLRSVRGFALIIFALPWLWLLTWAGKGLFFPDQYWLPRDPTVSLLGRWGEDPHSISHQEMAGIDFVLKQLWTYSPLVFVALFKWHTWRDQK